MILADTSAIVQITRDRSGKLLAELLARFPGGIVVTPFTRLEIMIGARDERNWRRLKRLMSRYALAEIGAEDWEEAARVVVDMRRSGLSVSDPLDCCIAQAALSRNLPLLHRDRDFEKIRRVRPALSLVWMD